MQEHHTITSFGGILSVDYLPNIDYFYDCCQAVLNALPENLQENCNSIMVHVENYADHLILNELNINGRNDLLGLYRGVPFSAKQWGNCGLHVPDIIYIYRAPVIRYAKEHNETVQNVVRDVLLHELGHHFGFSSEQINQMKE